MAAGAQGVSDAVIYGWLITGVGLLITMSWNLLNRRHSNKLAARIRNENFKLDQWNSVRDRIETCLGAFNEAVSELSIAHGDTLPELKKQCGDLLRSLTLKQDLLAQALKAADQNYYADGDDWEQMANGLTHDTETSWDNVMAIGEQVRLARSSAKVMSAVAAAKESCGEICDPIRVRVRVETIKHDPSN
jgi:hypothetical protein